MTTRSSRLYLRRAGRQGWQRLLKHIRQKQEKARRTAILNARDLIEAEGEMLASSQSVDISPHLP